MTAEIPTLSKRKLQAQVIVSIFSLMVAQIGKERAASIVDAAICKWALLLAIQVDFTEIFERSTPWLLLG